ncbi:MAG: hypothetical protein PWR24_1005 [Desulfonauticus sp.]|jgi:hypothetical protein|nr:hypothetical protein [Desulfonauticus sp.]
MKLPISLYWLLFFLLGTSQLAWSNFLPLIELWQAQGFCLENPEYEQDYIQFKGKNVYGAYWQCNN